MIQHDFEWKQSEICPWWSLYMDGLETYVLVPTGRKGKMWGALNHNGGAVEELFGVRWMDLEDAKKQVLRVANERYGKVPRLAPDYVKHSQYEPDEYEFPEYEQEKTPISLSEGFTHAEWPFDE